MKNKLFALAIAVSTIFSGVPEVLAQVDYWSHPHTPNVERGTWVREYTKVIRPVTDYVNGRQSPTTTSRAISYFVSYERVVVAKTYWDGQYTWYLIQSTDDGQMGWVRGDMFVN